MAILHETTLSPTKLELLSRWLPGQPWFSGDATALQQVGSFRFDDPDGEVGIETLLVTAGGDDVFQVPLTYRGGPPAVSPGSVIGTLEHGVLGQRWVSEGSHDPAYIRAVVETVLFGRGEAARLLDTGGEPVVLENDTRVRGSGIDVDELDASAEPTRAAGVTTRVETGIGVIEIVRRLGLDAAAPERSGILVGTWPGQADPVLLAAVQLNAAALRQSES
ncbi:maltokinase N-terminal cap-like domain-containing protein [Leucobacter triazinivorans]|uniref:Maltokinase N-terminal cap domain-containing protein n=1 Tax=Leucobacter triazinivorans TaxID=1784719 RepID=A0A4P6KG72_9MICO|nr:hypothetical protein [Leucobacter triazinivorans]QBE49220.1 hypothetical protein EVS81_10545 [Leucobacter triazinivorans]